MKERRQSRASGDALPRNPAAGATWLSLATFWYSLKIFKVGVQRDFDDSDLSRPLEKHRSQLLGKNFSIQWARELDNANRRKRKPGLLLPILRCFGCEIALFGLALLVMELACRIYQPLFIGLILRHLSVANADSKVPHSDSPRYLGRLIYYFDKNQSTITKDEVLLYAFGTILCGFINVLILHPIQTELNYTGMKIRIAICSLIYRKVLRLDAAELTGKTIGSCINILSNDVNKFEQLHFIHYLWLGPLTVMFSLYFLYQEIGMASFIGMCPVMFCIPLQGILGTLTKYVRIQTAVRTDNRVQVMNEILQGIRVLKMYAWEYPFSELIHQTRKYRYEMHSLIKASIIKGVVMSLILFITRSGHFLSCYFHLQFTGNITIETVFFIISYYQILRMTMTVFYPQGVGHVSEMMVATKRVKRFLMLPESDISNPEPLDPGWINKLGENDAYGNYYNKRMTVVTDPRVELNNVSLKYGKSIVLSKLSVTMEAGELLCIVGPVGSGKSCFMHMILEELKPFEGTVRVVGTTSYASQDPFLFAGSIRQNILFGNVYDRKKYNTIIKVCALSRDFTLLPYGDQTLVGEKGISLSGGQRARINLARAIYREADIYLLDDPLSAVDTNVGKTLFEECITGYLKDKVVVLATHQWQYLKKVDHILFLDDGKMRSYGNYNEVFMLSEFYSKLIPEADEMVVVEKPSVTIPQEPLTIVRSTRSIKSVKSGFTSKKPNQKEFEEMKGSGVVGCAVLKDYYLAGGNFFFVFLIFFLFIMAQCAASIFDYMMSIWAKVEDYHFYGKSEPPLSSNVANMGRGECARLTGTAIATTMCVALVRSFYFYGFCMRASIGLHNKMFRSVTKANLRFFTLNASGRILNRFSKDMGAVDEILPYSMVDTYQILLNFVGVIGLLIIINVWLLFITLFVCICIYVIRKYYLKASCSLKRLEGIARSPVFTHVNATMQGLAVIRSHGNEVLLVEEFDKFQDIHTSASFMFMAASRAFGYALDMLTVIYTTVVIYYFLIYSTDNGANVALILTQCIGLTGIFQWGMRQSAEFETQLTSVERVLEFTTLEPEPPLESEPGKKPPDSWPTEGNIELQNVSLRYSLNEPPVLKNISIFIKAQEKIGIVGRTGAGKSSIVQCLFRLAYIDGKMMIDNIDTGNIGLHDLRKKLSIIPQEPVIFSGTLRYNLDPFGEYSDVILYSALVDVDFKGSDNIGVLDEHMSDGGVNLSVGSRQLVCLARAIVRNNKILILDEATANVDLQTDNFIQNAIREKFGHCTVLTIAHRLNTIMDSDKVLVMDSGQVMEFEHPHILMQNPNSIFTELISKTGAANVEKFKLIAQESYKRKIALNGSEAQSTKENKSKSNFSPSVTSGRSKEEKNKDDDDETSTTQPSSNEKSSSNITSSQSGSSIDENKNEEDDEDDEDDDETDSS